MIFPFPGKPKEVKFILGNEACVEAAIAAGCRFFAGYPITPSTEIAEGMAKALPRIGGTFIQMEDEIASLGAVIGASICGLKALTATSGPGFSLKQEHIGYAALTEIPCVIVNVMRGGPSTGLPTLPAQGDVMQARWGTHGDHPAIVLSPSSVKEYYELTIKAFNLSEKFRTPVILLPDEVIAHTREKLEIPENIKIVDRKKPPANVDKKNYRPYAVSRDDEVPVIPNFGEGFRFNITGLIHDDSGFPSNAPEITQSTLMRLHKKIAAGYGEIKGIEVDLPRGAEVAVLSYGASFRSAAQAAKDAQVGLVKLTTLFPFPDKEVKELAQKVKTIIVVEMNLGQLIGEVERAAGGLAKIAGVNIANGLLITPDVIREKIRACQKKT
ncbi:2-oxoglutarate synthase subunit alpha [candidate division WOR-1 bacterium RIFCSPHIGHO2_01_FULL_53_15]|uniref:2-oxoglutarate synthase subunit alpha n=1 Tax=candidate division WOR-1 bacterium RIFCSPHIGHO2_01_FULL_53_15 TaxID=1802564 RepID=A0A1F4Q383_UNCSA|nr:MAG: 2-oxoglutarate synthase subunit alpha [candidate division WOR-1 bacterium RIFCSPHIGHO2_01_FULL_53_15]OGC12714.1 MAG: 2-oxoglutarate synthase subunit alpha [candidate division WOR-1 bacterium RIFCSPHIGHO2_02_FULL_53_26]